MYRGEMGTRDGSEKEKEMRVGERKERGRQRKSKDRD